MGKTLFRELLVIFKAPFSLLCYQESKLTYRVTGPWEKQPKREDAEKRSGNDAIYGQASLVGSRTVGNVKEKLSTV